MRRWLIPFVVLFLSVGILFGCNSAAPAARAESGAPLPACPTSFKSESTQLIHGLSVVLDLSRSTETAGTSRCDELGTRITQHLRELPPREDLVLFVTTVGDGVAPVVVANGERLSDRDAPKANTDAFDGPGKSLQHRRDAERRHREWAVDCLVERCRNAAKSSGLSIFAAVDAALGTLDAACKGRCASQTLALHSDLRDSALSDPKTKERVSKLAPALGRTTLLACGTRQTKTGSLAEAARIEESWKRLLGSIEISPLCAGPVQMSPSGKE